MTQTPVCFPENVRFNPLVGLKSFRTEGAGGAWRLLVLAKNLTGSLDHVERELLRAFARSLGIHDKTFKRWLDSARNLGFLHDRQRINGEWVLILASNKKIAEILNSPYSNRVVEYSTRLLFGKNWRAFVFASWQSAFTNNGRGLYHKRSKLKLQAFQNRYKGNLTKRQVLRAREIMQFQTSMQMVIVPCLNLAIGPACLGIGTRKSIRSI